MPGISDFDCEGTVTIDGQSVTTSTWTIQADQSGAGGLLPLLTTATVRGSDRILPGVNGVIPYRRRTTVTNHTFRLVVAGDVNSSGVATVLPHTDQLVANLAAFYNTFVVPVASAGGTRAMVVVLPGGLTGTGNVHVTELSLTTYGLGETSALAVAQLSISIPAGRLVWV